MVHSGGQNRCLCSSLPKVSIIQTHMLTGTAGEGETFTEIRPEKEIRGGGEG